MLRCCVFLSVMSRLWIFLDMVVKIEFRDVLSATVTLFAGPMCRQGNIPQSCTSGRRPLSPGPISHAPCQRPPALRPRPLPEHTTASLRGPTTASTCTAALAMKAIQFFLSFFRAVASLSLAITISSSRFCTWDCRKSTAACSMHII